MRWRMAARCGRDPGGLAQDGDVDIADRAAACAHKSQGSRRKMCEAAPFQRASVSGKCWPMSPAPMAPSRASVSACRATSASEWPSSAWVWAILTPHSQTWSPATSRCTSKPCPVRTSGPPAGLSAMAQVLGCGELAVGCAAHDQRHRQARPIRRRRHRRSDRPCRRRGRAWAARISAKRKPWGVCARHSPARSSVAAMRSPVRPA